MEDKLDRWKRLEERMLQRWDHIAAALFNPMVAILFWILAGLIITMTLAKGKFTETNIFEALGATGQVAMAVIIYRLTRQQFEHNKEATVRQEKIDSYQLRMAVYREWKLLRPEMSRGELAPDIVDRFTPIYLEIDTLFPPATRAISSDLWDALHLYEHMTKRLAQNEFDDQDERKDLLKTKRAAIRDTFKLAMKVQKAMRDDIRIV